MHLAQPCHYAVDVFAGRLDDGQIHYGLVFLLPDSREITECVYARKCADVDTRSRHGTIDNWYLGNCTASLPERHAVLLIPRTWLICNGYLSWTVLFMPYRSFDLRRTDLLKRHIWLEWPDRAGEEKETAATATHLRAA